MFNEKWNQKKNNEIKYNNKSNQLYGLNLFTVSGETIPKDFFDIADTHFCSAFANICATWIKSTLISTIYPPHEVPLHTLWRSHYIACSKIPATSWWAEMSVAIVTSCLDTQGCARFAEFCANSLAPWLRFKCWHVLDTKHPKFTESSTARQEVILFSCCRTKIQWTTVSLVKKRAWDSR